MTSECCISTGGVAIVARFSLDNPRTLAEVFDVSDLVNLLIERSRKRRRKMSSEVPMMLVVAPRSTTAC